MTSINGGNEGGLDAAVFLFRWRRREVGQRRHHARLASMREEEERWPVGPCGWAGPAGRLRPSGKGRENRPVKKRKTGQKGRMGSK
jgi:hypothetical protein